MPNSYTIAQLSEDLDWANNDCQATLTTVLPTSSVGVEFTASREELRERFTVEMNGREVEIDQRFFININGVSTYPSKGWVLSTGGTNYKVFETSTDASGIMLTLTCISRYAATP
jgi:hypothetical protein